MKCVIDFANTTGASISTPLQGRLSSGVIAFVEIFSLYFDNITLWNCPISYTKMDTSIYAIQKGAIIPYTITTTIVPIGKCIHSHAHTHAHTHTHAFMQIHTYIYIHATCVFSYTHACIHSYIHTLVHSHTHTHTFIYIYTLSYTHICIHPHTALTHPCTHTVTHPYTHTVTHPYTHTVTHSHTHALTQSHTHTPIHSHSHTLTPFFFLQQILFILHLLPSMLLLGATQDTFMSTLPQLINPC
jgi:hypothetical protein